MVNFSKKFKITYYKKDIFYIFNINYEKKYERFWTNIIH